MAKGQMRSGREAKKPKGGVKTAAQTAANTVAGIEARKAAAVRTVPPKTAK